MLAGLVKAPSRLAPEPQSRGGAGPRRARARRHGRSRLHHARHGQDGARRTRPSRCEPHGRRLRQLRRRLRDGRARRLRRRDRQPTSSSRRRSTRRCRPPPSRRCVDELDAKGAEVQRRARAPSSPWSRTAPCGPWSAAATMPTSQFNRAIAAKRQPGSSFKPFVYLAAARARPDARHRARGCAGQRSAAGRRRTTPANIAARSRCATRWRCRSTRSRCGSAWRSGRRPWCRRAQRLGISSPLQANASIALGTSEVTPLETRRRLCGLRQWRHRRHALRDRPGADRRRQGALPAPAAAASAASSIPTRSRMMNAMMHETLRDRHGRARRDLPGWEAAGKTGTSQDYRDAWFVGYTAPARRRRLARQRRRRPRRSASPAATCRSRSGTAS